MNIDMDELREHLARIKAITEETTYDPPCEEGCAVTYLRIPQVSLEDGLQEGIQEYHDRQRRKAKEQPKLRKGTKYYVRLVRCDGMLIRADKFYDGEVNVTFVARYENDARYLIPYLENGKFRGTYTYVTRWEDGRVREEFAVSGGQILRWSFEYMEDGTVHVAMVNAVPDGNEPVICWKTAIYTPGETITYEDTGYWDFWMKDNK